MISGKVLLPLLVGAAVGAAGWMREPGVGGSAALLEQIRIAEEQVAMLERENSSLRSLAQGGGEVAVPPEMIAQVEKDYGLTFLANPVFHRIAGEELGYRIEAAMESRYGPQGVDDRQQAYRWIGWLREGDGLLEQMVAVKSVGAVGWFDEVTGEAWVTDRFDLKNIPDQAAMMRLLVRILLNQHFPPPSAYPGDDAARAREALHAGAASGAEARFYAASARGIGFVPMNDNSAAARLLLTLSDFVQGVSLFPAVEGKGLADTLYVKGAEAFAGGLRKPPQNTLEIVLPGETGRGGDVTLPELSDEVYLKESAGYLGVRLWLSLTDDLGMAEEVSRSWVKDAYALFADGEMSSAVVWEVTLEDKTTADAFEDAATDIAEAMAEEGRFLGTARISENTVRFFNTAMKDTAEKLGRK
ncbi:MAG: hypothetical protein RLZZ505_1737 [Verrucomicrobiota bacterium]|jgi:hypothetical protein